MSHGNLHPQNYTEYSYRFRGIPSGTVDSVPVNSSDNWSYQESFVHAMNMVEHKYRMAAVHGVAIGMLPLQSVEQNHTEPSFSTQGSYFVRSDIGRCNSSELEESQIHDASYASQSFCFAVPDGNKLPNEEALSCTSFGGQETTSTDHQEILEEEESDDYSHLMNYEALKQTYKRTGGKVDHDRSTPFDLGTINVSPSSLGVEDDSSGMTENVCTAICSSEAIPRSSSVTYTVSRRHLISITPSQNGSNSFLVIHSSSSSSSAMSLTVITLPLLTSAVSPTYATNSRARLSFPFSVDHSGNSPISPFGKNNSVTMSRRRKRKKQDSLDPTPIVPILLSRIERVGVLSLSPSLSEGIIDNNSLGDSPILSTVTSFSS